MKNNNTSKRVKALTLLFIKEQIREPVAILWIMLSPSAFFYLIAFASNSGNVFSGNYIQASSWFYAYMSLNIALFGCSYYLIGRRESGFVRSFIYQRSSIAVYLCAHILSYSLIAICYGTFFYLTTRPAFGPYSLVEYLYLLARFFVCYTFFASIGLLLALAPLKYATANTLFSMASFFMLSLSYLGASENSALAGISGLNPLTIGKTFITTSSTISTAALIATGLLLACSLITFRHLRIQPIWSRY